MYRQSNRLPFFWFLPASKTVEKSAQAKARISLFLSAIVMTVVSAFWMIIALGVFGVFIAIILTLLVVITIIITTVILLCIWCWILLLCIPFFGTTIAIIVILSWIIHIFPLLFGNVLPNHNIQILPNKCKKYFIMIN